MKRASRAGKFSSEARPGLSPSSSQPISSSRAWAWTPCFAVCRSSVPPGSWPRISSDQSRPERKPSWMAGLAQGVGVDQPGGAVAAVDQEVETEKAGPLGGANQLGGDRGDCGVLDQFAMGGGAAVLGEGPAGAVDDFGVLAALLAVAECEDRVAVNLLLDKGGLGAAGLLRRGEFAKAGGEFIGACRSRSGRRSCCSWAV